MTLTLELKPEELAILDAQAKAQNVDVETMVHLLIAQLSATPAVAKDHFYFTATPEEWEAAMDELAEGGENLPVLPPEAYDRENLYEERL
jgi:hypothetical protein